MVLLHAPNAGCEPVVFSERGYVVPRPDGQILCGSTLEFEGFKKAITLEGIRTILDLAVEILPGLGQARWVDAWSGFRPWTSDQLPLLGRGRSERLWFSTGHYRNGILLAPASAKLVADLICGQDPPLDLSAFSADRLVS